MQKREFKFHWQKFLSKGVWERRTEQYISAVANSDLPDVIKSIEAERFKARRDPFARRIHNVTPWESRLKLDEQAFLESRSFFFGVPLVPPYEMQKGKRTTVLTKVTCGIVNLKDQFCGRPSDCCGHHAFVCPCTSKQIEHNAMRDAINHSTKAMGYFSNKEVTVPAWRKRPDNEIADPTGREATTSVDVSIRALVQEKMLPMEQLMKYAVHEKRLQFPVKDSNGHRVVSGDFVPFIMTNMGSLDKSAHQFLAKLRKKDRRRAEHLMDVLVVQHAKWIARRLHRCLGHFNSPPSERPRTQFSTAKQPARGRLQKLHDGLRQPTSGRSLPPRAGRSGPSKANTVAVAVQPSTCDELSRFFEQELETDMDARADYEAVRARSAKFGLPPAIADLDGKTSADAAGAPRPSVGVDFQEEICAELSTSAVSPSPLPTNSSPLSQLPSGDSPLESEDPSALNSQAFPAVIAAEPVAPLPGTQQVAPSTALSTPNSLASASSGMSPR